MITQKLLEFSISYFYPKLFIFFTIQHDLPNEFNKYLKIPYYLLFKYFVFLSEIYVTVIYHAHVWESMDFEL